mgnify:CR=1 FL=1
MVKREPISCQQPIFTLNFETASINELDLSFADSAKLIISFDILDMFDASCDMLAAPCAYSFASFAISLIALAIFCIEARSSSEVALKSVTIS